MDKSGDAVKMVKNAQTTKRSSSRWLKLFAVVCLLIVIGVCAAVVYDNRLGRTEGALPGSLAQDRAQARGSEALPSDETRPAEPASRSSSGQLPVINYDRLPVQAQEVYRLIGRGGPFAYRQDGAVFGNYERRLPEQARGYYREYTVKTPGVSHRGARRIVCGGEVRTRPQACYYTQDHYESFRRIVQAPTLR